MEQEQRNLHLTCGMLGCTYTQVLSGFMALVWSTHGTLKASGSCLNP